MRTNELKGIALDWAVAKAKGVTLYPSKQGKWMLKNYGEFNHRHGTPWWSPSSNWAQGGAIIEREGIAVWQFDDVTWRAMGKDTVPDPLEGATPLIAAMRCYVASKLGDEVQIPEELTHG
jgi:hypothetical protein